MPNSYYQRQADFAARTKAKGKGITDELDGVAAGFDKLPTPNNDGTGFTVPVKVANATEDGHAVNKGQLDTLIGSNQQNKDAAEAAKDTAVQAATTAVSAKDGASTAKGEAEAAAIAAAQSAQDAALFDPSSYYSKTNIDDVLVELIADTTLTGNPTAPTQTLEDSSTRLANTAFVAQEIAAIPSATAGITLISTTVISSLTQDVDLTGLSSGLYLINFSDIEVNGFFTATDFRIRAQINGVTGGYPYWYSYIGAENVSVNGNVFANEEYIKMCPVNVASYMHAQMFLRITSDSFYVTGQMQATRGGASANGAFSSFSGVYEGSNIDGFNLYSDNNFMSGGTVELRKYT
jgi:hypothetical protein